MPHGTEHSPAKPAKIYDRRDCDDSRALITDPNREGVDPETGRKTIKLFTGDWHVSHSNSNEMLMTILGSCISACIRDPLLGIGGMNHFLVPKAGKADVAAMSTRFGVNAMEQLLNGIYKLGGHRDRLEIKVFGGGNVTGHFRNIGSANADFVRDFLKKESFRIFAEDMEGDLPRRLHYFPDTGKVMLRKLRRAEDNVVVEYEKRFQKTLIAQPDSGDVDLF